MIAITAIAGAGVLMAVRFLIRKKYHNTIWVKGLDCIVAALIMLAAISWAVNGVALKEALKEVF